MPATTVPRDDDPETPVLRLDAFPPTGEPKHAKPSSWELYTALGSPKNVVAPMVDQSELAWRIMSRRHGAQLVYTPMINVRRFVQATQSKGKEHDVDFWIAKDAKLQEEGSEQLLEGQDTDRPVIVQFCANDPELLLQAAQIVEPYCQAVDLNLGCPQQIARKGHYGSFLQSDWQLIFRLINTLHINLRVPVTAKMRVFDSIERTVAYAQMLEHAGAQMIAVHGRTREMKGHKTGLADWMKIKAVKESVRVPVFANGNILYHEDIQRALDVTGADGVMSAEGNLYNPAIFTKSPPTATTLYPLAPSFPFPRIIDLAREYLDICQRLRTPTAGSAIKSHLFRLARPALEVHGDLRPVLGRSCLEYKAEGKDRYRQFYAFVDALDELLKRDEEDAQYVSKVTEAEKGRRDWKASTESEPDFVPHWLAQPYYRKTMPPKDEEVTDAEARREKRKMRLQKAAAGLTPIDDVQAAGEAEVVQQCQAGPSVDRSTEQPEAKRIRDMVEEAQGLKASANALFEKGQYDDAILGYAEVLNCLPPRLEVRRGSEEEEVEDAQIAEDENVGRATAQGAKGKARHVDEDEDVKEARKLRAIVYANLAACHAKLKQHKETVVACNEALTDDPTYVKALHRRAQANEELASWSSLTSALEDYKTIQSLPHPLSMDASLQTAMRRLPAQIDETSAREKDEMMGKLKGIGDSVLGWFGLSTDNFQMQKGEGGGYSLNFVK